MQIPYINIHSEENNKLIRQMLPSYFEKNGYIFTHEVNKTLIQIIFSMHNYNEIRQNLFISYKEDNIFFYCKLDLEELTKFQKQIIIKKFPNEHLKNNRNSIIQITRNTIMVKLRIKSK